ncbi:DUF4192 domain-containing protein [Nocardioides psychrotolerans]|uniref:DUF4192 domain-containing protein n=1 Tax=Nocardioides psychrotolerans TaxID=1005945 RepID=UPI003137A097
MRPHDLTPMTARCPDDLLAMVPVTLGFTPTDSVAMLTFGATHPFHARVDLPERRDDVPELVDCLVGPAVRNGVRRVVLVLYSEDEAMAGRVWRGLRDGFRDAGIAVLEALRADGRRWWPLLGGDRLAAELGVPYDVSAHPFVAQAVLCGRVTLADRDELARTLVPVPERVAEVTAALEGRPVRWGRDDPPEVEVILREGEWTELVVEHLVARGSAPEVDDVARLLRGLVLLRVRDAAWSRITTDNAGEHVAWWSDLLRRTPPGLAAPVATLLAWSAWQAGHGALAWCALDVALAAEPDYGLAGLLAEMLAAAVPPSTWADAARFDWRQGLGEAA